MYKLVSIKDPFILLCRIISVECPTKFDPCFMLIGCLGLPLFWLDASSGKFKFVGHSTEIIRQSEIKGPLSLFHSMLHKLFQNLSQPFHTDEIMNIFSKTNIALKALILKELRLTNLWQYHKDYIL